MEEELKALFLKYGGNQKTLREFIVNLEHFSIEFQLDFGQALNDFECVDSGECTHYNAFPCESGAVYCPTCEKIVIEPLSK